MRRRRRRRRGGGEEEEEGRRGVCLLGQQEYVEIRLRSKQNRAHTPPGINKGLGVGLPLGPSIM